MKEKACVLLAFFALACGQSHAQTSGWSRSGFSQAVVEDVHLGPPREYNAALNLVLVRGTRWTRERVIQHLIRMEEIYAPCGIGFRPVTLVSIDAPNGHLDRVPPHDQELADRLPPNTKPAIFFQQGPGAEAYTDDFSKTSPRISLAYTAWIGEYIEDPVYTSMRDPRYDTVAHEVAHILGDCGHTAAGIGNILAGDYRFVNDQITPEQCARFRQSPFVKAKINQMVQSN